VQRSAACVPLHGGRARAARGGLGVRGARAPRQLVDGSVPPTVPAALRAAGPLVMTRVRLVRAGRIARLVGACVPGDRIPPARLVVERVGVTGVGITFLGVASAVAGCDHAPNGIPTPWCGRAVWPLQRRRVSDPRLAICHDDRGRPLAAFGWVNPAPRAKWIVVDRPGAAEVYPAACPSASRPSDRSSAAARPFGTGSTTRGG
jgi:hypothetical protein